MEFSLCQVFKRIEFTRDQRIWCDGVLALSITRPHRRMFLLVGVAYSPNALAPFEVEFHYARRRDTLPTKSIVRFGFADRTKAHEQRYKVANALGFAEQLLQTRPKTNQGWSVAVELTNLE